MAEIMDGRKVAEKVYDQLSERVEKLRQKSIKPKLTVFRVGEDPASKLYVNKKKEKAGEVGIEAEEKHFPESAGEGELIPSIKEANEDETVNGILVQLPLPGHIQTEKILETVSPEKDVDGFHPVSQGKLLAGEPGFIPATPKGIIKLLDYYNAPIEGKDAVVIGRSLILGKPLAVLLMQRNATVTICHSKTKDLASHTREADILAVAVGKARLVKEDMVREGSVVIDAGINREGGKITGDVDFKGVKGKVSYITPVPGGVGPMTVAMLLENVVEATEKQKTEGGSWK